MILLVSQNPFSLSRQQRRLWSCSAHSKSFRAVALRKEKICHQKQSAEHLTHDCDELQLRRQEPRRHIACLPTAFRLQHYPNRQLHQHVEEILQIQLILHVLSSREEETNRKFSVLGSRIHIHCYNLLLSFHLVFLFHQQNESICERRMCFPVESLKSPCSRRLHDQLQPYDR